MNRHGFTLVEAIIVVVVIAALLAILIPVMRERERQRLQALADMEPWEVFEFRVEFTEDSFSEGEPVVVRCEIRNPTSFPLVLLGNPVIGWGFDLVHVGSDTVIAARGDIPPAFPAEKSYAPGKSEIREYQIDVHNVGEVDVYLRTRNDSSIRSGERQLYDRPAFQVRLKPTGLLASFRSNPLTLTVEPDDDSRTLTFEEALEELGLSESRRTEPWRIFRFSAAPAQERFSEGEEIVINCEIRNMTKYPFHFPQQVMNWLLLSVEGTDFYVSAVLGHPWNSPLQQTRIAPGESANFELRFGPVGAGAAEFRVKSSKGEVVSFTDNAQNALPGVLSNSRRRFQSNPFQLVIEASENFESLTFQDLIAKLKRLE